jgi:hypothetical protein
MGSIRGRDGEKENTRMFTRKGNLLVFYHTVLFDIVCLHPSAGNLAVLPALILALRRGRGGREGELLSRLTSNAFN